MRRFGADLRSGNSCIDMIFHSFRPCRSPERLPEAFSRRRKRRRITGCLQPPRGKNIRSKKSCIDKIFYSFLQLCAHVLLCSSPLLTLLLCSTKITRLYSHIQDSLASLARRMRVDMSCFSKTCQHLPHRIRALPRGAFILHRGIVPTMKRVSLFARVSHD